MCDLCNRTDQDGSTNLCFKCQQKVKGGGDLEDVVPFGNDPANYANDTSCDELSQNVYNAITSLEEVKTQVIDRGFDINTGDFQGQQNGCQTGQGQGQTDQSQGDSDEHGKIINAINTGICNSVQHNVDKETCDTLDSAIKLCDDVVVSDNGEIPGPESYVAGTNCDQNKCDTKDSGDISDIEKLKAQEKRTITVQQNVVTKKSGATLTDDSTELTMTPGSSIETLDVGTKHLHVSALSQSLKEGIFFIHVVKILGKICVKKTVKTPFLHYFLDFNCYLLNPRSCLYQTGFLCCRP